MATTEPTATPGWAAYSTFDLQGRYDDPRHPTEFTVFPVTRVDDVTTTWLTIDAEHAVSLAAVR